MNREISNLIMVNIFCCDINPKRASFLLSYTGHVHKMLLESIQIIAVVAIKNRFNPPLTKDLLPYRASHVSHPAVKWAASDQRNLLWLAEHAAGLGDIIWQVTRRTTATMASLQQYHQTLQALIQHLPKRGHFVLYDQNKIFEHNLSDDHEKRNIEIANFTLDMLCQRYQLWQLRNHKRCIKPSWPQLDSFLPTKIVV